MLDTSVSCHVLEDLLYVFVIAYIRLLWIMFVVWHLCICRLLKHFKHGLMTINMFCDSTWVSSLKIWFFSSLQMVIWYQQYWCVTLNKCSLYLNLCLFTFAINVPCISCSVYAMMNVFAIWLTIFLLQKSYRSFRDYVVVEILMQFPSTVEFQNFWDYLVKTGNDIITDVWPDES